jgi:hypothetical protein
MRVAFGGATGWCVALATSLAISSCGGGGGSASPSVPPAGVATLAPTTAPTATPTTGASNEAAFQCPASDAVATAAGRSAAADEAMRRPMNRPPAPPAAPAQATSLLAVTYATRTLDERPNTVPAREVRAGVTFLRQLDFDALGTSVRLVAVATGQAAAAATALRTLAGVRSVDPAGAPRYAFPVSEPAWPTDPSFNGFQTTVAPSAGATPPPPTYRLLPYGEASNVPGQWDMHVIGLEHALAYAVPGNGSAVVNPNAAGSASVRIAIIDTGEDPNHPELAGKIAYQHCFITDASGHQSASAYAPDPQGHGTNVAGIAAATSGNALGFTGAGGAALIDAFRVFPTPDDACATPDSKDPQCTSNSVDIAAAINLAVAQGANVISLSLGGGVCTAGNDPDGTEGKAVANALAHGIVVVAASGNTGGAVSAPACDTGVIAVGASALDDGQPNGSNHLTGSATAPVEYVASYANTGTSAMPNNAAAWGIVAPGGDPKPDPNASNDPSGATADNDDLHWIENIWTTTPFDSKFGTLPCKPDYGSTGGTADCRVLIAGTSMAAPHVAGIAALIIAASPTYQSSTKMKALLCASADDIGDPHEGCGRLNAYRAMAMALGDTPLP